MTLNSILSRIKVDKSNPHVVIPVFFDMQDVLQKKYYILTRSETLKAGITVGKIHGYDKSLLSHMKPEKEAKILSQLLCHTISINQPQMSTNVPIRREVGRVGLRKKVTGSNPLLNPNHLRCNRC